MARHRQPTAAELEIWRRAMADTVPLREGALPDAPEPAPPQPAPAVPERGLQRRPAAAPRSRHGPALDPERPVDLDRRTWLRLKRGQVVLEASLDLHGQTQAEAHDRLGRFLASAQTAGRRCVLVVTGKGLESGGTLRHMVPRWLNEPDNRERVIAYCPAQPRHGGSGALYVLVRRRRPGDRAGG
jgi:DNA-nicking Smr family endonuclease